MIMEEQKDYYQLEKKILRLKQEIDDVSASESLDHVDGTWRVNRVYFWKNSPILFLEWDPEIGRNR